LNLFRRVLIAVGAGRSWAGKLGGVLGGILVGDELWGIGGARSAVVGLRRVVNEGGEFFRVRKICCCKRGRKGWRVKKEDAGIESDKSGREGVAEFLCGIWVGMDQGAARNSRVQHMLLVEGSGRVATAPDELETNTNPELHAA
jgi:hypothetical protein